MRRTLLPPLLFLAPLLWLFRRALFLQEMFAFRDSSHFYYPLYKYVQERWRSGVPLWNPLDNLGQPLLGDPTAAVLYPGKLVFTLPFEYSCCFALYVVLHLWLAGCGAYVCARNLRATRNGALLCGLSYELSGQVLFQYCNPIFCVGAAWLPWALVCFERLLQGDSRATRNRYVVLLGVVLSLMVFGGDPQIAYHCLMLCGLRLLFFRPKQCSFVRGAGLLICASVVALLLSAVQVFPSYVWASQSDRAIVSSPRTIFDWAMQAGDKEAVGLDAVGLETLAMKPRRNGHVVRSYEFSVGPWRWPELFFPNISGPMFPVHGRWIAALPGEGRTWTPSLYLGLVPILLAVGRLRLRSGSPVLRWLGWLTVLSVAAAMGNYGAGWLVNEFRFQMSSDNYEPSGLLPGFGGLYWLLTVALPGYVSFRYPAKWWTTASLGLALLASKGWPMLWSNRLKLWKFRLLLSAILVPTVVAAFFLMRGDIAANSIFGPFQRGVAWRSIVFSAIHVLVLVLVTVVFIRYGSRRKGVWLVVFVLLDLLVAQRDLIQTKPTTNWTVPQEFAGETLFRSWPRKSFPKAWAKSSSVERLVDLKRNDARTLMPKHHLTIGARSLRSSVAMTSADYAMIWEMCREVESDAVPLQLLSNLGASHVFAPAGDYSLASESFAEPSNLVRYQNPGALPRAWLAPEWEAVGSPPNRADREAVLARTRRVMLDGDRFRDLTKRAYVETDIPTRNDVPDSGVIGNYSCEILADEPERILVHIVADGPAILVLRDQFTDGWEARFVGGGIQATENRAAEFYRVNRVMRGVYCGAGEHTVEIRYRPREVFIGAIVSGIAWPMVLIVGVFWRRRQRA